MHSLLYSLLRLTLSLSLLLGLTACVNQHTIWVDNETSQKAQQVDFSTYKDNPLCQQYEPDSIVTLTEDTALMPNCVYSRVTFRISKSNLTLDCKGSLLNGINSSTRNAVGVAYSEAEKPMGQGILIHGSENHPIKNIKIKNCQIHNYLYGIWASFDLTPKTHAELKNGTPEQAAIIEDRMRTLAPQKIIINNVRIKDSHKAGMFINHYIHNLEFNNGVIDGSGNTAIYLESGTRDNLISHSKFRGNGYYTYNREERLLKPREGVAKREAIAIDSSAWNTLLGNHFEKNAAGSIFLYKNCYEHHTQAGQLPRHQHSHSNTIRNNHFENEQVGVWIASRQSRDLKNFKCGDPLMFKDKGFLTEKRYYYDYAKNTHIKNNQFVNVKFGVKVEDDDAHIMHNRFAGQSDKDIVVGTAIRSMKKNKPVNNTRIESNQFDHDNPNAVEILYGSLNTQFNHNYKRSRIYQAPCTTPFNIPAKNAPERSCSMLPKKLSRIGASIESGTVLSAQDKTREGAAAGVWGNGEFMCDNGRWIKRSGYCCFGKSCN